MNLGVALSEVVVFSPLTSVGQGSGSCWGCRGDIIICMLSVVSQSEQDGGPPIGVNT